jgi:hypothetical protein
VSECRLFIQFWQISSFATAAADALTKVDLVIFVSPLKMSIRNDHLSSMLHHFLDEVSAQWNGFKIVGIEIRKCQDEGTRIVLHKPHTFTLRFNF